MPDLFVMRRFRPAAALFVAVAATGTVACASSSPAAKSRGAWKGENAYGTEMARKGFWREALFRYEKAAAAQPANAEVQNNLGVAYESVGETSRALAAYKKALELAPQDAKIKRNYARFAEYYTSVQRASSLPAPSSSAPPSAKGETPGISLPKPSGMPPAAPGPEMVPPASSPGSPAPPPAAGPPAGDAPGPAPASPAPVARPPGAGA